MSAKERNKGGGSSESDASSYGTPILLGFVAVVLLLPIAMAGYSHWSEGRQMKLARKFARSGDARGNSLPGEMKAIANRVKRQRPVRPEPDEE